MIISSRMLRKRKIHDAIGAIGLATGALNFVFCVIANGGISPSLAGMGSSTAIE